MESNVPKPEEGPVRAGVGMKMAIVAALAFAVGATLYVKGQEAAPAPKVKSTAITATAQNAKATPKASLPKLVDLGAGKCIPCKAMAPILEDLKQTYAGKLDVIFIDVWEKPEEADPYHINLIPTQIFYDTSGKERFRHEGFFSREDILAKWKELGVNLPAAAPTQGP